MNATIPAATLVDILGPGFAAGGPNNPWFHVKAGPYLTADGLAAPLPGGGLRVAASGVNPATGEPAFTISLEPESRNGGIAATNDHARWLAYVNRQASSGFPGFDAAGTGPLVGRARVTGRTFGTSRHPFGAAVSVPNADLRLAAFAMVTIDVESWMVFDFFFTSRRIYAFYERLPFGRTAGANYAAFSYAIPVRARRDDDVHEAAIAWDGDAGVVRWILDGAEVYRVTRIGCRLPGRQHLLIDLGGTEEVVRPRQLDFGLGLFTLLDGAIGSGPGLVRLSDSLPYYAPRLGEPHALAFVDEESRPESRLFGQGAEMTVMSYTVGYEPSV